MASKTASLRKAQVPLSCHFCNEQAIQWKCEECDVFMCTSCKEKIHQRIKSIQDHEIVSVSDIFKDNPTQREVSSEVISSVFNIYTTTVPAINALLCSGDDFIYFICHNQEEMSRLVKGKMLKSSIRILQTLEKKIFDIAVNKEGVILFTEMVNNDVCILNSSGEIKTVLDISPMKPLALHVNMDNEIIVGFREQGPAFPVTDFSVRQIMIFDSDYKRKVVLATDTKGRKLFNYPARIRTDSRNVLYVSDFMEDNKLGRIVAVDVKGRVKFTYYGYPDLHSFYPFGIAITPSDNIILSDLKNNAFHVLNSRGELLGLHFVDKEYNIELPNALAIDSEGYLLIGNVSSDDHGDSYAKVYVGKIAENFM
ncbi:tripartite motif-containing protein 2-like [Mytilus edulis]|uniref:tripartite motif-containing protein 2-like n=1 Tax=Mytilus edulis TaxID=6550 RepID=UPI0039EFCD81